MPRNTLGDLHKRQLGPTFVREWREYRKLSQEGLAELVGVTKSTLSRIERGKQPYSQRILEGLSDSLGCSPADLITRLPEDPEGPWAIWESLNPTQRKQAIRLLRAIASEMDEAA